MASLIQEVGETFVTLFKGFSVTLRNMFRPTTTENFPDVPPSVQPRYRGIHVLQRDEHGYEKCVGCFLCAAACPANCIYIKPPENPDATASPPANATPKFTTSIIPAAFSVATASKPVPPTRSPTATAS